MIDFTKIKLTRQQLALFLPNHESIKEFERLFAQDTELAGVVDNIIIAVGLTTDGVYIQRAGSTYLNSSTSIYEDSTILDAIAKSITVGTGVNTDGTYSPYLLANYITSAISLDNADELLDNAIYTHTREFVLKSGISIGLDTISQTVLIDATAGDIDVTLPNPALCFDANRSRRIAVHKIDTSTNIVNILPFASELVVFEASQSLLYQAEILNFITDGINWYLGA